MKKQPMKGRKQPMKKQYPDSFTMSRFKMEEYLSRPIGDPWVDYMQECYNPTTKQRTVRLVKREYAPWFIDAARGSSGLSKYFPPSVMVMGGCVVTC